MVKKTKAPRRRKAKKRSGTATTSEPPRIVMRRLPIERIKIAEYNPRQPLQPGDPAYRKLKRSIEKYGLVDPLIWNERTGNLVGGHQRLRILQREYQVTSVDVSVVDLSEADEKALNIALNRIGGSWQEVQLAELLAELQQDPDIDVTVTGYDRDEMNVVITAALAEIDQREGDEPSEESAQLQKSHAVLVTCADETEQRTVYEWAKVSGYKARVLTL